MERSRASRGGPLGEAALFGVAYLGAAHLGQALSLSAEPFATLWPPGGLFFAVLAVREPRRWGPFVAASLVANLASDAALAGRPLGVALGFWAANACEAALGAWAVRRFVAAPLTLLSLRQVLGFFGVVVLASTPLGAALGAAVASLSGGHGYAAAWRTWWIADLLGVLGFAPALLLLRRGLPPALRGARALELAAVLVGIGAVAWSMYGVAPPVRLPRGSLLVVLVWAALRTGPQGTALGLSVATIVVIASVASGGHAFLGRGAAPAAELWAAQVFLCIAFGTLLVLAASLEEVRAASRRNAELVSELSGALAEVKTLRGLLPICAHCKKMRDENGRWHRLEEYLYAHTEVSLSHGICPQCFDRHYGPEYG